MFNGIRLVTLASQNQLKAQITVDTCTEEMKETAANTASGAAEKRVSPNVASSKYVMQVQNQLGKAVVGIGAVSLKTYFMMSTANNRKVTKVIEFINKGDVSSAITTFNSMLITNPINDKLTTIANTNLQDLYNLIKDKPAYSIMLTKLIEVIDNTKDISTPEFLSGIISLAADNAKDLALPKLNATSDLVDIYTTAAMIGIPFKQIANIMVSPMFE